MASYLKFLTHTLYHTRWYLVSFTFILFTCVTFALHYGNLNAFLLLNSYHIPWVDKPAIWLTEPSSGLILLSIFVLITAKKYPKDTLLTVAISFIAWYISIAFKSSFFQDWRSPSLVFGTRRIHLLIPHLQPELNQPSSHAAIISASFLAIAYLFNLKQSYKVLLALCGTLFMYSRTYVGWNYLGDIIAGAIVGLISVLLFLDWFRHITFKWYNNRTDLEQGLIIASLKTAAICTIFVNIKHAVL